MAVITPMGMDFDWSPKDTNIVKTASTKVIAKSDKDLLYEAAKKAVKAQFMGGMDKPMDKPMDGSMDSPCGDAPCGDGPCGDVAPSSVEDGMGDVVPDEAPDATDVSDVSAPSDEESSPDVEKAVKELVEKANKAEDVASKVQDAVGKVEKAVQEVKDALGVAIEEGVDGDGAPDEIEIEVEDLGGEESEEVEKTDDDDKADDKDKDEEVEDDDKDDDIVQESKKACASSKKVLEMKSAATEDDLAKFAALSPSVKRKIYDYWKNDLKYAPDYCKLLVTDS